jgi:flagellin
MSGIILSASVRQNLLSLQSTADLLATTQNRLSTGKKVNTALDNPTNYFTAQGLDNRANDISNLLDSIGNGVQVLQAANTGITSLQKLVDTAKSIANQVLQAPAGYSVKASATSLAPTTGGIGTAADLTNGGANSLNGKTFVFTPATGAATTITVSSTVAAGNVNSIDAFNTALSAAGLGLTASLATDGSITLTSTNDNASQSLTLGTTAAANTIAISGTDTATLVTPAGGAAGKPLADAASQTIRANLVSQYNNIIQQITTTSQDASFNGINLLNGEDLKLTFNETGKSTLTIKGVTFDAAGLGLASLTAGTDFLDRASANATIAKISAA